MPICQSRCQISYLRNGHKDLTVSSDTGKEETLEYYGKIGELEQELGGQFARIHKGYLVNLNYEEEYTLGQVTHAVTDVIVGDAMPPTS